MIICICRIGDKHLSHESSESQVTEIQETQPQDDNIPYIDGGNSNPSSVGSGKTDNSHVMTVDVGDVEMKSSHLHTDGDQSSRIDTDIDQSDHMDADIDQSDHMDADRDQSDHMDADRDQSDHLDMDRNQSDHLHADQDQLDLHSDRDQAIIDRELNYKNFKLVTNLLIEVSLIICCVYFNLFHI